ncbi:hypothetical protein NSND_62531 [Nitrospira sp. ND1]|nr:hypothetical protein NSND_62531 [Nitrospira sp. ND1]
MKSLAGFTPETNDECAAPGLLITGEGIVKRWTNGGKAGWLDGSIAGGLQRWQSGQFKTPTYGLAPAGFQPGNSSPWSVPVCSSRCTAPADRTAGWSPPDMCFSTRRKTGNPPRWASSSRTFIAGA